MFSQCHHELDLRSLPSWTAFDLLETDSRHGLGGNISYTADFSTYFNVLNLTHWILIQQYLYSMHSSGVFQKVLNCHENEQKNHNGPKKDFVLNITYNFFLFGLKLDVFLAKESALKVFSPPLLRTRERARSCPKSVDFYQVFFLLSFEVCAFIHH